MLPRRIFVGGDELVNRSLYREIVRIELTPMGVVGSLPVRAFFGGCLAKTLD